MDYLRSPIRSLNNAWHRVRDRVRAWRLRKVPFHSGRALGVFFESDPEHPDAPPRVRVTQARMGYRELRLRPWHLITRWRRWRSWRRHLARHPEDRRRPD